MTRPLRIEYPGALYHVMNRGNSHLDIFLDDNDRKSFLILLEKVIEQFGWICHSYCLMNNHYHLLIETPDANLSKGMRQLNGIYTQRFNRKHNSVGHVFQGRYKSILVEKEIHLLEVYRYIVLNPLKANLVENIAEYQWSSYPALMGKIKKPAWLDINWTLEQFGSKYETSRREFKRYVNMGIESDIVLDKTIGQIYMGSDIFIANIKQYLHSDRNDVEVKKEQRFLLRPALTAMFTKNILNNLSERNKLMVQAYLEYGYSLKEISKVTMRHYSTISNIIRNKSNEIIKENVVKPKKIIETKSSISFDKTWQFIQGSIEKKSK